MLMHPAGKRAFSCIQSGGGVLGVPAKKSCGGSAGELCFREDQRVFGGVGGFVSRVQRTGRRFSADPAVWRGLRLACGSPQSFHSHHLPTFFFNLNSYRTRLIQDVNHLCPSSQQPVSDLQIKSWQRHQRSDGARALREQLQCRQLLVSSEIVRKRERKMEMSQGREEKQGGGGEEVPSQQGRRQVERPRPSHGQTTLPTPGMEDKMQQDESACATPHTNPLICVLSPGSAARCTAPAQNACTAQLNPDRGFTGVV